MQLSRLLSYLPGIAWPMSYVLNISTMIKHDTAAGANPWSYLSYYLANLAAFLFLKDFKDWRTIASFLFTGLLEFLAVFFALRYNTSIPTGEKALVYFVSIASMVSVLYLFFNYRKQLSAYASIVGYIPAIVFPLGTWFMYLTIKKSYDPLGVSTLAWVFQFLGNIGAYFLGGEKKGYTNFKVIAGFLLTALINILILYELIIKQVAIPHQSEKEEISRLVF